MAKKITITMSRTQALQLGLLTCECGHPVNNHFDFRGRPCAFCNCGKYEERAIVGSLVKGR